MNFFIAQLNPIVGDLEGNAKKILNVTGKAYSNSADIVLTPELSLWGYPPKDCLLYTSPSPRDATLSRMPSSA